MTVGPHDFPASNIPRRRNRISMRSFARSAQMVMNCGLTRPTRRTSTSRLRWRWTWTETCTSQVRLWSQGATGAALGKPNSSYASMGGSLCSPALHRVQIEIG